MQGGVSTSLVSSRTGDVFRRLETRARSRVYTEKASKRECVDSSAAERHVSGHPNAASDFVLLGYRSPHSPSASVLTLPASCPRILDRLPPPRSYLLVRRGLNATLGMMTVLPPWRFDQRDVIHQVCALGKTPLVTKIQRQRVGRRGSDCIATASESRSANGSAPWLAISREPVDSRPSDRLRSSMRWRAAPRAML